MDEKYNTYDPHWIRRFKQDWNSMTEMFKKLTKSETNNEEKKLLKSDNIYVKEGEQ